VTPGSSQACAAKPVGGKARLPHLMGSSTKVGPAPSSRRVESPAENSSSVTGESPPDLYARMLVTGCLKCTLPIVFIILSKPVSSWMDGSDETQEQFEQIAGGLLLYTFAFGCWGEIAEKFEEEAGPVHMRTWRIYAVILLLTLVFSPLFYGAFEVDWGTSLFDYGVTGNTAKCPEDYDFSLLPNVTRAQCDCNTGGRGAASTARCEAETFGVKDLIPYLIGFALDGMVLVLLESEDELFAFRMMFEKEHKLNIIISVFLKPVMFALDNVLTGTAMSSVLTGVAASTGTSEGLLYVLCCAMTIFGVLIAMGVHKLTAGLERQWMMLCRLAFLILAAVSFLDNGLDMIRNGLTFWVGVGFCLGWFLKLSESIVDEVLTPWITGKPYEG